MCGRYRLSRRKQIIEEHFETADWQDEWLPRHNVAPTQRIPVIRQHPTTRKGEETQIALRGFMCSEITGSTKTSPEGIRLLPASIGPHKYFTTRHFVFTMEPACSASSLKTSSTIELSGLYSLNKIGSPARNPVRRRPGRRAIQFALAERLPRNFAL